MVSFAIDNTRGGTNALAANTTGADNSAFGVNALVGNTTGSSNSALGRSTLYDNTSGSSNTAAGANAMRRNTTGGENSAFGSYALYSNTTGGGNTASGSDALRRSTTGRENAAVGHRALYSNTTGSFNTGVGWLAIGANTNGYQNTAVGAKAMEYSVSGYNNTAVGVVALRRNSGDLNVALGISALSSNTSGSRNIAIGSSAGSYNISGNDNIWIGNNGSFYESNTIRIGSLQYNAYIAGNVFSTGDFITSSVNGVINCGGGLINPRSNVISDSTTPTITIATGDEDLYIDDALVVSSTSTFKTAGGSWLAISDRRLKEDIQPFEQGLSAVLEISPVWFRYVARLGLDEREKDRRFVGVIAQDMASIAPYMVEERDLFREVHEDEDGVEQVVDPGEPFLTFDPSALPYLLVNAVQEQQRLIDELRSQNDELRRRVEALERK